MRKALWNIYAWPITAVFIVIVVIGFGRMGVLDAFDLSVTTPALVALHLHIWNKKFLSKLFWQPYAIAYLIWDLAFNIYIRPHAIGKPFDPWTLLVFAILLPLDIALILYAFKRTVSVQHLPNPPLNPDPAAGGYLPTIWRRESGVGSGSFCPRPLSC
jgi:hypothetical protein